LTDVVAPGFDRVAKLFASFKEDDPTYSAQLCAYRGTQVIIDLACGPLSDRGLLLVLSASKASIAVVVGQLVESRRIDLDQTVAHFWPEFAAAGKAHVTVRQLLSHQAGLVGVDGGYTRTELLEHEPLAERLAAQRPLWQPGRAHGYHGITIGVLADELVRRITGVTLAERFRSLTLERGVDLHLGLPETLDPRVHDVLMPTAAELTQFTPVDQSASAGLDAEVGMRESAADMVNDVAFRRVGPPAAGGFASAAGLARLYACIRHDLGARRLLRNDTIGQLRQLQSIGLDLSLGVETRFGIVFMLPTRRIPFGSRLAYGHDGAGGAMGFDDPVHDVSVGYVVQRIPLPGGCDARLVQLAHAVRQCLAGDDRVGAEL
jgi:CubicO group peptidase (beta-lactamase class C family)